MTGPVLSARYRALLLQGLARPGAPATPGSLAWPERCLVVDVARQRLGLLEAGVPVAEFPVSTAAAGVGSEEGSFRTPLGWHRIHARIGEGADPGTRFRERVPTGAIWKGEGDAGDLILGRILTLEGLEPGLNRGPGVDSLERTIYIHGTNHADRLGQPVSHGCVRMACGDILDLFGRVREGDPVLVSDAPPGRIHFAGVGGSGMSALAQFVARASGSDRGFDQGRNPRGRALLEAAGVRIFPQDGSGVDAHCEAVVFSTAVEEEVPDIVQARRLAIPLIHRSELLAHFVREHRTLAISGTSGKSTAVAMAFEILRGAGLDPSVITGGELLALRREGLWGNAWAGTGPLVIEADESDGSLVNYHPAVGVILNLQKDHKEMDVVAGMFRTFRDQVRERLCVGDAPNLAEFAPGATVFGGTAAADLRCEAVEEDPQGCSFTVAGTRFSLPVPGRHNVENAMAALAGCAALGVPLPAMAAPLAAFQGVARRFQVVGSARGVEVVDDFGHNPAKIAASLATAKARAGRVLAVFQPHGYGPLRFLRRELVETFTRELRPQDRLWMLDVFYAGGTVTRDISSGDVVAELQSLGVPAFHAPSREGLVQALAAEGRAGDLVLVMGARDPSLTALAEDILAAYALPAS